MHIPRSFESATGLAMQASELRKSWHAWIQRQLLAYPKLIPLSFGLLACGCVVGVGILTLPLHAGFPFWMHGCVIALSAGVLVAGMAYWLVRELHYQAEVRYIRLQAAELISHEICNSLQVLMQRDYVNPADRERFVNAAIERIRNAVRDVLPSISDIGPYEGPTLVSIVGKKRKAAM